MVIVGAGIAGLEAAWIAAARGHDVTVFGRSREVGGKVRVLAALPGGESLSSIYDYQYAAARRAGARFELGVEASCDDILSARPEAVILATGSTMIAPRWLPAAVLAEGWVQDLPTAMLALEVTKAPDTISSTVSRLTAPCTVRVSGRTPSKACLAS